MVCHFNTSKMCPIWINTVVKMRYRFLTPKGFKRLVLGSELWIYSIIVVKMHLFDLLICPKTMGFEMNSKFRPAAIGNLCVRFARGHWKHRFCESFVVNIFVGKSVEIAINGQGLTVHLTFGQLTCDIKCTRKICYKWWFTSCEWTSNYETQIKCCQKSHASTNKWMHAKHTWL